MSANTERLWNTLSTVAACLCREARVDSNDLMSSVLSFGFKHVEEGAPTGITNRFGQMMIFHHPTDIQVFNRNTMVLFSVWLGHFEMEIAALTGNLQVRFCDILRGFTASVTALLASAQLALLAPQRLLRRAIEAGILNHVPLRVSQEYFQADINADIRMGTRAGGMLCLRNGFAHDERVPMPIGTQDQMDRLRGPLYRAMHFDLEGLAQLGRNDEMLRILVQRDIFAILPELERVPAIRPFEAWEPNPCVECLTGKEPFEGLGEAIGKRLHGGGWHMLSTTAFEVRGEIILAWKGAGVLILLLDRLKHLIIDGARLVQAVHKQAGLGFIRKQAIFVCSHGIILWYS